MGDDAREAFDRFLDRAGLLDHADELHAFARPCLVAAKPVKGPGEIGTSRIGGQPDLPPSIEWPMHDDSEEALGLEEFTLEFLDNAAGTVVGGYPPSWSDENVGYAAHLSKNGLGAIIHRTHFDSERALVSDLERQGPIDVDRLEASKEQLARFLGDRDGHVAAMSTWRRLLSIGSHREAQMTWWDAGLLQLVIHEDDLRAGRFDRTHLTVLSS